MKEEKILTSARLKEIRSKTIYDTRDIKDIFGISDSTIYRWVKQKKLKPSKIGKKLFFRKGHIETMMRKNAMR